MCHHEKPFEKKNDKMQINSHTDNSSGAFLSDPKMCIPESRSSKPHYELTANFFPRIGNFSLIIY